MRAVKIDQITSRFTRMCIRAVAVVTVVTIYCFGQIGGAGISGFPAVILPL